MPYGDNDTSFKALNVSLQIVINNMVPVEKRDMHFYVDMLVRQYWTDPRLTFEKLKVENEEIVLFNEKMTNHIWKPDIYFPNSKEAQVHKTTLPNRLIWLSNGGNVFYSQRVSMQVYCKMNLRNFPFDVQKCHLFISSYGHSEKFINLHWNKVNDGPIYIPMNLNSLEFTLTDIDYSKTKVKKFRGQIFDRLGIEFTFERNYAYYVLQMYLPVILTVMLSWVGFWIDYRSTPARVSLGITTVLTMVTLGNSVRTSVPQSNYLKSIDIYIIICLCFVFLSVIEYALIGIIENKWEDFRRKKKKQDHTRYLKQKRKKRTRKENIIAKHQINMAVIQEGEESSSIYIPNHEQLGKLEDLRRKEKRKAKLRKVLNSKSVLKEKLLTKQKRNQESHMIDRLMKKFLPFIFFLFNAFYFYFSLN